MPFTSTVYEFRRNLEATLDWCCPRFSMFELAGSLRSEALKPTQDIVNDELGATGIKCVVDEVIGKRRRLLAHSSKRVQAGHVTAQGRLLVLYPEASLWHGLSVDETGGFIDANEIPAWDTWILFTESFLLSWIPPELVSAVQSAIDCNPEESILWAADVQHLFIHELAVHGLLH